MFTGRGFADLLRSLLLAHVQAAAHAAVESSLNVPLRCDSAGEAQRAKRISSRQASWVEHVIGPTAW